MSVEPSPGETSAEPPQLHLGRAAANFARDLVIAVVIGVALFAVIRVTLQHVLVEGPSMEPTYFNGQRVWVNTLAYKLGQPERGDVVVFHFKYREDQEPFIKRIIGLPGEQVEVRDGKVYVDGKLLDGLAGFEYNAGCWVFRTVFQRIQAASQVSNTAFIFQIEFNGIGSFGTDQAVDLLKRNVPGYSVTNPADARLSPPSARPALPFEQVY